MPLHARPSHRWAHLGVLGGARHLVVRLVSRTAGGVSGGAGGVGDLVDGGLPLALGGGDGVGGDVGHLAAGGGGGVDDGGGGVSDGGAGLVNRPRALQQSRESGYVRVGICVVCEKGPEVHAGWEPCGMPEVRW